MKKHRPSINFPGNSGPLLPPINSNAGLDQVLAGVKETGRTSPQASKSNDGEEEEL